MRELKLQPLRIKHQIFFIMNSTKQLLQIRFQQKKDMYVQWPYVFYMLMARLQSQTYLDKIKQLPIRLKQVSPEVPRPACSSGLFSFFPQGMRSAFQNLLNFQSSLLHLLVIGSVVLKGWTQGLKTLNHERLRSSIWNMEDPKAGSVPHIEAGQ